MEGDHRTTVMLETSIFSRLKAVAQVKRVSMSRVIEWALLYYFSKISGGKG